MGLLSVVIIAILGYICYLIYKKELTWPIWESIAYKKVLKIIENKNYHPKSDEISTPKGEETIIKPCIKEVKPTEGTHIPKPKGKEPVIKDLPNGKKEVISGDKSILIDRVMSKYFVPVDQKFEEANKLREKYLEAKNNGSPNKNKLYEEYDAAIKEAHQMRKTATTATFNEVNVYMTEEDAIDLHGLQIEGAIDMVKEQITQRKAAGKKIVKVQCGMGHHNTVGFSKLREAVVKYCGDEKISFTEVKDQGFVNISL